MSPLVQFVGDPFVDAGVAVLEIRLKKPAAAINLEDLARQADELASLYSKRAWTGYLTVHFPNSCWCNATMGDIAKEQKRRALLKSFDFPPVPGRLCAYCRRPAQHLADRSSIPLITGAATMTAGAGGEPGLPVCSACQFAAQFYPLATLKVSGKPLFWWTPHHEWMFCLTKAFAQRVAIITEASPDQFPNLSWPSTRLLETAEAVFEKFENRNTPLVDLTGCHVTNYGSGPDYEEIRLSRGLLEFLRGAQQYPAYRAARDGAWETEKKKRGKNGPEAERPTEVRRNFLFEDLGKGMRAGSNRDPGFVRRYFVPQAGKADGFFEIACLYARKVLDMTNQQIEAIKELAGRIAASRQAADYLDRLFQRRGLVNYIRTLTDISDRMARANEKPLSTDTVLRAFDLTNEDDPIDRGGTLVRELLLLRLIESLPKERLQTIPQLESSESEE